MAIEWKTRISREKPAKGEIKTVVGLKDSTGGRWEFDGKVPKEVGWLIMTICTTGGKQSYAKGQDQGIEAAFFSGAA